MFSKVEVTGVNFLGTVRVLRRKYPDAGERLHLSIFVFRKMSLARCELCRTDHLGLFRIILKIICPPVK